MRWESRRGTTFPGHTCDQGINNSCAAGSYIYMYEALLLQTRMTDRRAKPTTVCPANLPSIPLVCRWEKRRLICHVNGLLWIFVFIAGY